MVLMMWRFVRGRAGSMMVCRLAQLGRHVDADADVGMRIVVVNAASSSHPDPVKARARGQALLAILPLSS
jgi:hypothetical protein